MRIGLNGRFLCNPYSGIGQYTENLLNAMAEADSSIRWVVVVPEKPKGSNVKANEKIEFVIVPEKRLPTASLRKFYWEQIQVPHAFKRNDVAVAHYPYPANPRFPGFRPPKTVVTVHDVIPWVFPEYRKRLRTRLYQNNAKKALFKADHVISVSKATELELCEQLNFPVNRITTIYEAASPQFLSRPQKCRLNKPYFLYVGGYDPRKNVVRLIEAYQEYIAPRYDIDLILIGGEKGLEGHYESPEKLRETVKNLKIKDPKKHGHGKIRFTEFLPIQKLAGYYHASLGLVNVSLAEGFNIPLLEAASCGAPIITSDIPIHREIIGSSGLFCDPTSTKNIGETLLNFLRDKTLQDDMRNASLQLTEKYSWQSAAEQTLRLYKNL